MTLLGRDLVPMPEKAMREVRGNDVAMIFQDPMTSLNPTMTIGRQIAEPVRIHKQVSKQEATDRAIEVLQLVGMPRPAERLNSYPHQLSGGLRQRVMIAIALACEPKLLIADEPTTALDVTIQAQILDLIDDLRERLEDGRLLITHDMGVIAGRTDRVMVMYAGKIVEGASTPKLFSQMRHPYSEALLDSIPKMDADASIPLYSIPGLPPDLSGEFIGCRFEPRCRNATEKCRVEEPPLLDEGETTSWPASTRSAAPSAPRHDAPRRRRGAEARRIALQRVETLGSRKVIVEVDQLVKEFPVTAGAILQRKVGSVKAVSDVSLRGRERARRSGSSASRAAARRRSDGSWWRSRSQHREPSVFDGQRRDQAGTRRPTARTARLPDHVPGPLRLARPPHARRHDPPRAAQGAGHRVEDRAVGARRRAAARGRPLSKKAIELYPHEFSGGQRQRIGFARALTLNPRLIVADEPVSALDVSIQSQILNMMKALQQTHRLTYIVISHDLAVLKYLSDRIGVMYLGKLVEVGAAKEIYETPAHPYTRGLIDTIPVPDPVLAAAHRRGRHITGELPSAITPPSGCRFRTRCPCRQELCAAEEPPLQSFGGDHMAACHFPLQTAGRDGIDGSDGIWRARRALATALLARRLRRGSRYGCLARFSCRRCDTSSPATQRRCRRTSKASRRASPM